MKYGIMGLAACLAVLLIAVTAPALVSEASLPERVWQHEEATPAQACPREEDGGLCSYLPIVEIDTGGVEIPGRSLIGDDGLPLNTLAEDGQKTIAARMRVIGGDCSAYHHQGDAPDVESAIRIRIRGNSSRNFDKPSYAIRLVTDGGENNPQSLMGMDAHHEWVLHGPWLDKTALRNYLFYNLSGEIMGYAPNVRYCELVVDGAYQGLYLLTESITAGRDGARLQLNKTAKRSVFTGYLLRLDHRNKYSEDIRSFTGYTLLNADSSLEIMYPGHSNRDGALEEEIRQDFSAFEKALYSYDYDRSDYGYRAWVDVDSFVDYFIINEVALNTDAGLYSTYVYKDVNGLLQMCVWDFNNACDNYFEDQMGYRFFFMPWRLWYWMMVKDEDFTDRIISRYRELRQNILSDENLDRRIDGIEAFLEPALVRNDARWGDVSAQASTLLNPPERNLTSRGAAIGQLKGFLFNRCKWLDAHIETLRQYSAASRVKKFNEVND